MTQLHEVQMLVFLNNQSKVITHLWFPAGSELRTRKEIEVVVYTYLDSLSAEKQFEVGGWDLIDVVEDCYIDRGQITGFLH